MSKESKITIESLYESIQHIAENQKQFSVSLDLLIQNQKLLQEDFRDFKKEIKGEGKEMKGEMKKMQTKRFGFTLVNF